MLGLALSSPIDNIKERFRSPTLYPFIHIYSRYDRKQPLYEIISKLAADQGQVQCELAKPVVFLLVYLLFQTFQTHILSKPIL